MTEPVIPDETERLRIFLREAEVERDQLRADKAELLEGLVAVNKVIPGVEWLVELLAKHEAKDAS